MEKTTKKSEKKRNGEGLRDVWCGRHKERIEKKRQIIIIIIIAIVCHRHHPPS
jgi:hypothetical protein